jgi:hypothetical protein
MNKSRLLRQVVGIILLVIVFSVGSGGPATAESPTPTPLAQPAARSGVFKLVRAVPVTADKNSGAVSGYAHYVRQTDRLVVILGQRLDSPVTVNDGAETCMASAYGYKEYTTDMEPTGKSGFLSCALGDMTSRIIGDSIYLVKNAGGPGWNGERLEKYDPVTWKRLAYADIPLEAPNEAGDGPTISFINGQIDVTGEYFPNGNPDAPRGSHHHFFTTDLKALGKMILQPPQYPAHCPEVSMLQEPGGDILMFAATTYTGDLIVLRFDKAWNFKELKKLHDMAFFPTGSVADGDLVYVAYTDTSRRKPGRMYRNVRLAAYDANWNTLHDIAVTDFVNTPDTYIDGESPWVQLHGNRLYVSYIVSTLDPVKGELIGGQAYVNIYELMKSP